MLMMILMTAGLWRYIFGEEPDNITPFLKAGDFSARKDISASPPGFSHLKSFGHSTAMPRLAKAMLFDDR